MNTFDNVRKLDEALGLERVEPAPADADRDRWNGAVSVLTSGPNWWN